jgi:aquaporin rerated protein, other eukaryote
MAGRLDVEAAPATMNMNHGQHTNGHTTNGRSTNGYTLHGPTTDSRHATHTSQAQPSSAPNHKEGPFTSKAVKNHFIAASGEFLGTLLFLWLAFAGVQTAGMNSPNGQTDPQRLLYMSLSFGMSLLIVVWAFYRISGGLFNPAVTLGLVIAGQLDWMRGLVLLPFQLLGGICAAALVRAMFPGPMSLFQTRLSPETSVTRG